MKFTATLNTAILFRTQKWYLHADKCWGGRDRLKWKHFRRCHRSLSFHTALVLRKFYFLLNKLLLNIGTTLFHCLIWEFMELLLLSLNFYGDNKPEIPVPITHNPPSSSLIVRLRPAWSPHSNQKRAVSYPLVGSDRTLIFFRRIGSLFSRGTR